MPYFRSGRGSTLRRLQRARSAQMVTEWKLFRSDCNCRFRQESFQS
jgi:hypothetical protein